ncbi:GNAT family N-acetyltransferase [Microbacterium sp. CIAB417]|uniref:GNAT family N-acetyltransferase n=1 Tax=Microbacterium sp. CIAB417 TaxID=2860287 RepID=UPI001FAD6F35|nr:GNAT family N-acetyltransferase [Microbacterium sp. CIAB417]
MRPPLLPPRPAPSFPPISLPLDDERTVGVLTAADIAALTEAMTDPELRRWLPVPHPYTRDHAMSWVATSEELRRSGRGLVLAVREAERLVAGIDAKRVDWRARTLELSYWTAPGHRGRGIMAAAVRTVAEALMRDLGFERIELRIAPENAASLRTAARAGFLREGIARNAGFTDAGRVDLVTHSLIPADVA